MPLFKRRTPPAPTPVPAYKASETTTEDARTAITDALPESSVIAGMLLPHLSTLIGILTEHNATQRDAEKSADLFFRYSWGVVPSGSAAMYFAERVFFMLGRTHEIPRSWKSN